MKEKTKNTSVIKKAAELWTKAVPGLGMAVMALLLSRAEGVGGSHPFGFAFFAAVGGHPLAALGGALGLLLGGAQLIELGRYIFSAAVFMAVWPGIKKGKLPFFSRGQGAALAAIITPAVGLFLLFISMTVGGYPLLYDCIVLLAESATVYVAAMAFGKALPLCSTLHLRRTLTGEETLCFALLFGGCVSGLCGIRIFGSLDIGESACVLLVLIYAIRFGSLHGGAAGAVMGLICALSRGRVDASPASFAISGIAAGYLGKKGKGAACLGFILTNAVVTVLANGSSEVLINLSCSLAASALLFLIPKKFFNVINSTVGAATEEGVILRDRLMLLSRALYSAETAMRSLSATKSADDEALKENLYSRTHRRVCSRCGLRKYCWGKDEKNTRQSMDKMAKVIEAGGKPGPELAPAHCIRPDVFTVEFGKMHDLYMCDRVWSDRRRELQATLCTGFAGINGILGSLAEKGGELSLCDELLADDIRSRLRRKGVDVRDIYVTGSGEDTEIRMTLSDCGGLGQCEDLVPKILEEATGLCFAKTGLKSCGSCRCHYVVAPEFNVEAAAASAVKENRRVSGDFSTCCLLDRNTFAMTLCDGCGSGDEAARESRICATLLISLLEAGMSAEDAINLTNSLILGSGGGSYTAIDLCVAELGGSVKFYKCGTAATYMSRDGGAEVLAPGGLPIGSGAESGAECYERSLSDESTLVLISDGVALSGDGESRWIKELIEHGGLATPQKLASEILNRARDRSSGVPQDDMTVIAASIKRRKQA